MTKRKEPPAVAILAARMIRAYPALSPYSAASLATELESIERAQRMHALRWCNGDYDRDGMAENACERAGERIKTRGLDWTNRWAELMARGEVLNYPIEQYPRIEWQNDPRGAVLLLRLPGEAEAVAV